MSSFIKIEFSPEMVRLVERIMGGDPSDQVERIMQTMETMRERLDALREVIEADESRRAEIQRLRDEAQAAQAEKSEAEREELIEDEATAEMIRTWETERTTLQARIAELEAIPRMTIAEAAELDSLILRLQEGPPEPTPNPPPPDEVNPPTPTE